MSNKLTWQPISEAQNIDHYNVYRSIIGVISSSAGPFTLTDGMTLIMSIDDGADETCTFVSGDFADIGSALASEIVNIINAKISGVLAHQSDELPYKVYIRSLAHGTGASVQIKGGTSNAIFGFTTEKRYEKSKFLKIAEVAHQAGTLEYTDNNGKCHDWYQITAVDTIGNESAPSLPKQCGPARENICIIWGKVQDGSGHPIADAEVIATIECPPKIYGEERSAVTKTPITTLTLEDGTFELELLQGAIYIIEIPLVDFTRRLLIPELLSANLFTLKIIEKCLTSSCEDETI